MKWCTHRLRSFEQSPPGSYIFAQGGEKPQNFPAQPMIEAQGQIVSNYRKGNGLPRSSVKECIEDISCYTCWRLGNLPQFCIPIDAVTNVVVLAMSPNSPVISGPCKGCGAPVS